MSVSPRARRLLHRSFVLAAGSLLFALALCAVAVLAAGDPRPRRLGNHQDNLVEISSGVAPYRVAVLGDTQKGIASFGRLMEKLAEEKPAFYVHTGDLVSHNDDGHWLLARLAVGRAAPDAPFLVAAGNHDVKGGDWRFAKHIGPSEISFGRGGVGFVFLDNASGPPRDLRRLEIAIEMARVQHDRLVLFMHVPPFRTGTDRLEAAPGWEEFLELCRGSRVRYVVCGHAHGYTRFESGGIVWIANGIGGDSESWQADERVMATVLEVGADGEIRDRPVEVPRPFSPVIELEHFAIGHAVEPWRRRPIWAWGLTGALAGLWGWAVVRLPRRRSSPPAKTAPSSS